MNIFKTIKPKPRVKLSEDTGQQNNNYTVRSMFSDLNKWENFLEKTENPTNKNRR